jgi:death-on-curing protein
MIKYLILEEIEEIHELMLESYGGLPGVRDQNLLESSIEHPKMMFAGQELYRSIYDKAAAYLYHIARNHPFIDGNKRTAAVAAIVFLKGNDIWISFQKHDLEEIVVDVAKGVVGKEELASFFEFGKRPNQDSNLSSLEILHH